MSAHDPSHDPSQDPSQNETPGVEPLALSEGVDYAWSRPNIPQLVAAGKRFACRYGGPGSSGKQLDPAEAQRLSAAGVSVVANAEGSATGLLGGWDAGVSWARSADSHFRNCGMPSGRPIYLSVDFDVQSSQWSAVASALRGAASVIGTARVGVYGGRRAIEWARRDGVARWFWQTYAWSGGVWVPGNHIEQYRNGVQLAGATLDLDRSLATDFGQWKIGDEDVDASDVQDIWQHYLAPEGYNMQDHLLNAERQAAAANAKLDSLTVPQPAPVDPAAIKAALLDPEVLAAIAKAVNDDAHRRLAG
jgi:hypothetical protein